MRSLGIRPLIALWMSSVACVVATAPLLERIAWILSFGAAASFVLVRSGRAGALRFVPFACGILPALAIQIVRPGPASGCLLVASAALLAVLVARWNAARAWRKPLLAAFTGTSALLAAELVAAHLWPRAPGGIVPVTGSNAASAFVSDAELGQTFAPHFRGRFDNPEHGRLDFATNGAGFRDDEWSDAPREPGEARVLVLGDSVVVGYGVELDLTLPAYLQRTWSVQHPELAIHVLNAGVTGYGPCQERVVLERLIDRVHPSHVVAVFYDGNDFPNCSAFAHRSPGGIGHRPAPPPSRPPTVLGRSYWKSQSALYRRMETLLLPWMAETGFLEHHAYADLLRISRTAPGDDTLEELRLVHEAYVAMSKLCAERAVPLLIVRFPMRVQTEIASFERLTRMYGSDPSRHDRTLPGRAVLEACAKDGIPVVDLLPAYEIAGAGPNPRYFREGHPNRDGNRVAAERIAGEAERHGWFDRAR